MKTNYASIFVSDSWEDYAFNLYSIKAMSRSMSLLSSDLISYKIHQLCDHLIAPALHCPGLMQVIEKLKESNEQRLLIVAISLFDPP